MEDGENVHLNKQERNDQNGKIDLTEKKICGRNILKFPQWM